MSDENRYQGRRLPMAPSAVAGLVLGITACCFGWDFGVPGIILGAIGGNLSRKAKAAFDANPGMYRGEKIIEAGLKWNRVGLIQGIILIPVWIILITLYILFIVSMVNRWY